MKSIGRHFSRFVYGLLLLGFLMVLVPRLQAQHDGDHDQDDLFNPPPCDFSNRFYNDNGVDATSSTTELNSEPDGRFGTFRQFGPPSRSFTQPNWVSDSNCARRDPTRRNFRILATTGAYKDDSGAPTEFFSIIAFAHSEKFFLQNFTDDDGKLTIVNTLNPRGISQESIVGNFEAYGATKQRLGSGPFAGTLAPTPCGSLADSSVAANDCFPVSDTTVNGHTLSDVATPNLRQDWRVASNRNAMDSSDNNCINNDPSVCAAIHDSPFGYFCDDLLGMWIVTYFWYTQNAVGGTDSTGHPFPISNTCKTVLAQASAANGVSLDGTPIIHTGDELHFIEGVPGTSPQFGFTQAQTNVILADEQPPPAGHGPCGAEGNLAVNGSDNGAVWLVCPVIPDPRDGAISLDAFLDQVHKVTGEALDNRFNGNFSCLQTNGQFPLSNGTCPP